MEHQSQQLLDTGRTESTGQERGALRTQVATLVRQQQAIQHRLDELAGKGPKGSPYRDRGDLLEDLHWVDRQLEAARRNLEIASHEAGSRYEVESVPRGGQ